MKKMKIRNMIGNLIIAVSIVLGIWLSVWVMLAGGIMQIVDGVQTGVGSDIAWGIIRVIFCEIGSIPMWIGCLIGGLVKFDE